LGHKTLGRSGGNFTLKLKPCLLNTYHKIYSQFEHGFFGSITLGILASSCLGGIAAMAVLQNGTSPAQMFQLFLVVASAMAFNGSVLSQQKPKAIFNLLLVSVAVNTVLTIYNFSQYYG